MTNPSERMSATRMSWRRVAGGAAAGVVAALAATTATTATPAAAAPVTAVSAHDHGHASAHESHTSAHGHASSGAKYYFAAGLLGRNEVREPGKKVNDRDGVAVAKFRIQGDRFWFFVQWRKTGKPTAFHIHQGRAGKNGPVVIDLLGSAKIHGNTAAGSVRVKNSLLKRIKANPKNWYANFHSAEFPDGAVRGQLIKGGRW